MARKRVVARSGMVGRTQGLEYRGPVFVECNFDDPIPELRQAGKVLCPVKYSGGSVRLRSLHPVASAEDDCLRSHEPENAPPITQRRNVSCER